MQVVRVVGSAVMVTLLSGCASMGAGKQVKHLESQVSLLDERVTQLERMSTREPSAAALPEGEMFGTESTAVSRSAPRAAAPAPAKSAGLKPTTREIQQALKNAGFYQGKIDGKTGPMTREAVQEFQRINGLAPDGLVGKKTWAKLSAYADAALASGEVNAAEVLK